MATEFSVTYGVTPLNDIANFHVVQHLPQDVMHVILEGSLKYETELLLRAFVAVKKYFTINDLNERIACFEYSYQDKRDKPSAINPHIVTSQASLRQSGM